MLKEMLKTAAIVVAVIVILQNVKLKGTPLMDKLILVG